jgi:hypothetical protein
MLKSWYRLVLALCVAAPMGMALADDTFRCGNRLIEPGMTRAEVRALCGEPTSKSVEVQDVRSGTRVMGKTEVQRWTYEAYSATRVLVFDQDKLKDIE